MIQFLGLHIGPASAHAVALSRDLEFCAEARAEVVNSRPDAATGVIEVPPAEWVRSGSFALQEVYFQLPARARKVWGVAFSGPSGWVALDPEYEPLSPIRLTGDASLAADVEDWFAAHPRLRARMNALFFPKDYLRFALSGSLATDTTEAFRAGWLDPAHARWSENALERAGLARKCLPPVFGSAIAPGRLSEAGIRRTSLPSGVWVVAGAHEVEAAVLALSDPFDAHLVVLETSPATRILARTGSPAAAVAPAGWRRVPGPLDETWFMERAIELAPGETLAGPLAAAQSELAASGLAPGDTVTAAAQPGRGAALLALIASGLGKRWRAYYALVPRADERQE